MASENNFQSTVESLFKGMDSFITTKTVVGDAITVGDTIILPLVDVTFGVGAGAFSSDKKNNGGGGLGGKVSPSAVLVISGGVTKLVNIKNQDGLTKILDMVPDFLNKFTDGNFDRAPEDKQKIILRACSKGQPVRNGDTIEVNKKHYTILTPSKKFSMCLCWFYQNKSLPYLHFALTQVHRQ